VVVELSKKLATPPSEPARPAPTRALRAVPMMR
jgi:hypothetical protein